MSFEHELTPLLAASAQTLWASFCPRSVSDCCEVDSQLATHLTEDHSNDQIQRQVSQEVSTMAIKFSDTNAYSEQVTATTIKFSDTDAYLK